MKILRLLAWALAGLSFLSAAAVFAVYWYIEPQLPSVDTLRDVRFQVPLRIFTADDRLLAEFGEKRRVPVSIDDVPPALIQAFLAAEDDRFYEHPGVDYQGLLRAVFELIRTGEKRQGGSTITMQVARNFFLSREKSYLRKLTEIFLALKIEHELSKNQILELYLNKIYLGQRAYGVGAAARVYYGVPLDQLRIDQLAVIAGLPKAPSRDNPVTNPERARQRRDYVLRRMYTLDFLDAEQYRTALHEPIDASLHKAAVEVMAPYVAEMARADLYQRFGEAAYTEGYQVHLSIDSRRQAAATSALHKALKAYDERHGYRGAVAQWPLEQLDRQSRLERLAEQPVYPGQLPGLVTAVAERSAEVLLADGRSIVLPWEGMSWARAYATVNHRGPRPKTAAKIVAPGDLIYLSYTDNPQPEGADAADPPPPAWRLTQLPAIEGALVSLDPQDGAIQALVGGYDFKRSKFNRATQARRQPGSGFKPMIYSAALEKGFTPASIINDAPVVFDDPALEKSWRPENYSGRFYGPTRLREALIHSRNLVSIRLLQAIGVPYAIDYAERFGFKADELPRDLSLALGSASVSPLEMARAYAVFANGGYLIDPYLIQTIQDSQGQTVYRARPATVCPDCEKTLNSVSTETAPPPAEAPQAETREAVEALPVAPRVIEARNAWLMRSLMKDVIRRGTGRKALQLGRRDLAGKTGTTNDQRDAWFDGYNPRLVAIAWVGFDDLSKLGRGETGGRAALPMWIDYMRKALKGVPETEPVPPEGLVTVKIDPDTGLLAPGDFPGAIFETFRSEHVPQQMTGTGEDGQPSATTPGETAVENIF